MSDADCTPGREPRSVAASYQLLLDTVNYSEKDLGSVTKVFS